MNRYFLRDKVAILAAALTLLIGFAASVNAVDVISNGDFSSGTTGWTHNDLILSTAMSSDGTDGNPAPSLRDLTAGSKSDVYEWYDNQSIGTINNTDSVFLSLWWQKIAIGNIGQIATTIEVRVVKPSSGEVTIWSNTATPGSVGVPITGSITRTNVTSLFDETGSYEIRLYANVQTGKTNSSQIQINWDNIILDVEPVVANDPPVVTNIPNQTIPEGGSFTTITLDDYVSDPNDADDQITWTYSGNTELLVDISSRIATITTPNADWNGAETITFRATDPGSLWDEDPATFTVTAQNDPPTVTSGATQVSVSPVNRYSANTTVISTQFTDIDEPGVGAFNVTFKILEQDNITELTILNNQPNGGGGLTISDDGGGLYTANYTYNPDDAQTLGLYDLYFEVTDGSDNVIDDYSNNVDEMEIIETAPNNPPTVTTGATQVSITPVNRYSTNTSVISTQFTDIDQPGVGAFNVTFKILEQDNITELTIVNNQPNGGGGLTISDDGGGLYTASYTYNPDDAQTLGLYDLYFEVTDGTDNVIDDYANNVDEFDIFESIPNFPPLVTTGATNAVPASVNRLGAGATTISTTFSDANQPGINAFTVTFKILRPDNITEIILVNAQTQGNGGLTIIDLGSGSYRAEYSYNPIDAEVLGFYDLYFEVSDGVASAIDDFSDNVDNMEIIEVITNETPVIVAGAPSTNPVSIDRLGAATTELSVTFSDADSPGLNAFYVTFILRAPYSHSKIYVASMLQEGQSGMSVIDNGGGSYTATISWNPPDNQSLGYYDITCEVSDGIDDAIDSYDNNPLELLLANGGENSPPVVQSDAVTASPAGIERIGANPSTISAVFQDADLPGVNAFNVTFKLREPDDVAEITLADNAANGASGVTITDGGGGIYTASVSWDPSDVQELGFYDLYFHVTDGADTSYDHYINNFDEVELYDAVSNNAPTLTSGNTVVLPVSVNRIGGEFTMIKSTFSDVDMPGNGAFTITIKVRDASLTEYTLVDAAQHGLQGLRVKHITGGTYEASVLWNPDVSQVTGDYDLYFYVEDNNAAAAADDYSSNTDELSVVSTAILGDGNLLHRTNDASNCGGPNSACHDIVDHQSQDCRVCHTPHNTKNIYLIRETIQTPNSGPKAVIFKTLGIGDPHNDPDPTVGDPFSGVMADSTDGVFTGVCEVCHTDPTDHHRNDGSQTTPNHHDAEDCTTCHSHSEGFPVPESSESGGGNGCSCHSSFATPMTSSTSSYHHMLLSQNADYTISSKTCLTCHVHHDIFRPDLNVGIGQRAKNLRVDITTPVVQGDNSVLTNTDYSSSGTGGICLSCHTSAQTKSYAQPDGTTQTPAISKSEFDAATTAHNYVTPSTFSTDGSTFNANCVKCHGDENAKSYQNSTNKFSTHDGGFRRILNPMSAASPSDPLEEDFCFECHSGATGLDYYGTQPMTANSQKIQASFGYTYTHPTTTVSGEHEPIESAADLADGSRHAECSDCHNSHAAQQGTHDGTTNLVSNALKGTWGVEPTSWPAAPIPSDNANVFAAPSAYDKVEPAQKEYQICLKCHSNYTTLPNGKRNLAEEINPNYPSTHGITIANQNSFCNTTTMNEPWGSSGSTYCSDCHRSSVSTDPEGPHGSNVEHLLVATIVSDDVNGTPLCHVCHKASVYWDGSATASRYPNHPADQSAHQLAPGCFSCHMWDYSSTSGLGVSTTDDVSTGTILIHGQNKYFNYYEEDGTAGTGDSTDAFVNGYIANIDFANKKCWAETCKNHSNKAY